MILFFIILCYLKLRIDLFAIIKFTISVSLVCSHIAYIKIETIYVQYVNVCEFIYIISVYCCFRAN